MKRIFAIVLTLMSLALLLALPVSAEEQEELREVLIKSMETEQAVEVGQYEMSLEEMNALYNELLDSGAFPWYADSYFDWSATPKGTVTRFSPRGIRVQRFDEKLYEQKMAELLAATCREGMPDWLKALNIHDYIVTHCSYNIVLSSNTGYDVLASGRSACFGYAQLYMDAMKRAGVPCRMIRCVDTGDGVGHAWNAVMLEGSWYHVDLTWDDPVEDAPGRVMHEHFLKSDEQFLSEENGHDFGWDTDIQCPGGKYSQGMFWEAVNSSVYCAETDRVIVREMDWGSLTITAVDPVTFAGTKLYTTKIPAIDIGSGRYYYKNYGLAQWGGRVYFCTQDKVYSMLPDGSDLTKVYAYDVNGNDRFIYGAFVRDGVLTLSFADHEFAMATEEVVLETDGVHIHGYESQWIEATELAGGGNLWSCDCGITFWTGRTDPVQQEPEITEPTAVETEAETAPTEPSGVVRDVSGSFYVVMDTPMKLVLIGAVIAVAVVLISVCRKRFGK